MRKVIYITLALALPATLSVAQQTNSLMLQGNKNYQEKKYKEAAADYQKALQKNPSYTPGLFNLGNSLYQQQQLDASRDVFANTAKLSKDKTGKGAANYNIGNTYMQQKKWEEAVAAYKDALRNNPQDADAKYNLSYAEEMLKQQKQNGGGKNKQDQNKDKKDDKKKQDQNKDKDKKDQQNKDQQNKPDQNKDKKDDQQNQPQSQPSKLSQQQADQLLNALQQEEKKLQDKKNKEQGVPVKMDKDW
jgi:tetratricopeptide (TPR) repeat protein